MFYSEKNASERGSMLSLSGNDHLKIYVPAGNVYPLDPHQQGLADLKDPVGPPANQAVSGLIKHIVVIRQVYQTDCALNKHVTPEITPSYT
jgi:hypothetical protein